MLEAIVFGAAWLAIGFYLAVPVWVGRICDYYEDKHNQINNRFNKQILDMHNGNIKRCQEISVVPWPTEETKLNENGSAWFFSLLLSIAGPLNLIILVLEWFDNSEDSRDYVLARLRFQKLVKEEYIPIEQL